MSEGSQGGPAGPLRSGPLLGRAGAIVRLCRAVEAARDGRGSRVWVVGPAGVGKTRLLEEVGHYAAWRGVPFCLMPSEALVPGANAPQVLQMVDPVSAMAIPEVDTWLAQQAARGALAMGATRHARVLDALPIDDAAVVSLEGLDPDHCVRLLSIWLGGPPRADWADRVIRETRGLPGRLRAEANRMRSRPRHVSRAPGSLD